MDRVRDHETRHRLDQLRQALTEGAQASHRAVELASVEDAARPLHEAELFTLSIVVCAAEDFASGGRFRYLDGLAAGGTIST